jgi:hypothetical protein
MLPLPGKKKKEKKEKQLQCCPVDRLFIGDRGQKREATPQSNLNDAFNSKIN